MEGATSTATRAYDLLVTPAALNAIFAATGKPVRSLPLKNVKLV